MISENKCVCYMSAFSWYQVTMLYREESLDLVGDWQVITDSRCPSVSGDAPTLRIPDVEITQGDSLFLLVTTWQHGIPV